MIFGACQSCEAPPLQCPYLEIAIAKKLVCWQIREWYTRTCLLSIRHYVNYYKGEQLYETNRRETALTHPPDIDGIYDSSVLDIDGIYDISVNHHIYHLCQVLSCHIYHLCQVLRCHIYHLCQVLRCHIYHLCQVLSHQFS
jgi:hypothetical protein